MIEKESGYKKNSETKQKGIMAWKEKYWLGNT